MAESVVKLRIDSKEYDANIKRAGQALTDYFNKVRVGTRSLDDLDNGVLEAVRSMGSLDTASGGARGALRELTQATTDMTVAYRSLTDEERNSPIGQAMAQSIAEMTERAGNARDAMHDVAAAINNAASDTRKFDQAVGGIQLMTTGFQTLQGAAKLFGIETEDNVEVLAKLQAAMAVTSGLQTAQNLLQSQSALMMGVQAAQASVAAAAQTALAAATGSATIAQKAFNVVANMNPYVALATAVAAVGAALYAFCSANKKAEEEEEKLAAAAEEAKKKADEQRSTFVNASAEMMNTASRLSSLQTAYMNANSEMEKTDILRQAQSEFKKLGIECNGLSDAQKLLIDKGSQVIELIRLQGDVAAVSAVRMEAFRKSFQMLMENGYSANAAAALAGYNKDVQELDGQLVTMQSRIQNLRGSIGRGGGRSGGRGTSAKKTGSVREQTEEQLNSSKISSLTNEYINATAERRTAIEGEIAILQKRNEEIQKLKDMAMGKAFDGGMLDEVVVTAERSFSPLEEMKKRLEEINALMEKAPNPERYQELEMEAKAVQANIDAFKGVTKETKKSEESWQSAASAIQQVGSAMSQIEDPAAKVMGTIAQAIATVALGYAQATAQAASMGPWAWIAFAATGLATMISTISAIHSATGYAEGGIIPGNSYSGDNQMAMVNAGEVILNRSQQSNLASQLADQGGGMMMQPYVDGEKVFLGMNNHTKRSGKGEIVTTSMLRRMGLM